MSVNLIEERMKRGLSLSGMAKKVGINRNTLKRAEDGGSVHPANALKIADFLEYEVTEIWPLADEKAAAA